MTNSLCRLQVTLDEMVPCDGGGSTGDHGRRYVEEGGRRNNYFFIFYISPQLTHVDLLLNMSIKCVPH